MNIFESERQADISTRDGHACNGETILIVDDEYDLVDIASFHLQELGYQTEMAFNSSEALSILTSGKKIDLVFSDIVMPGGLSGFKLARKIKQKYSGIKMLLTSAYIKDALDVPGDPWITSLTQTLLKKPYTKAELIQAISKALDTPHVTTIERSVL